jgi:glycerol-3-phosphate dehydrogenase
MTTGQSTALFDVAIIGGGINGCGIARDAAGRGWSVFLCDKGDLAGATSSASTKLIHGGLRYLEYLEFRLVREALVEREILWKIAPHIIWPVRFILPLHEGLRPAWVLRLGLFLYDHLGGRRLLPPTRAVRFDRETAGGPLKPKFVRGFEYSDCWVEDSRLVALNAMDAFELGATIAPRTRCLAGSRESGVWRLTLRDEKSSRVSEVRTRTLVNAAGPWAGDVLTRTLGCESPAAVRLVKGSHIVVPKLYAHARCYLFQNADGRVFFAIPFENSFTLIGTTDLDYAGDPDRVDATPEEIAYLCQAASEYFETPVAPAQVKWTYSGVRPLYDDGASEAQAATRDYVLKLDVEAGAAPLVSIFGGKITTYRRLAESALTMLKPYLPEAVRPSGWTAERPLPGGDFPMQGVDALSDRTRQRYPFLPEATVGRLVRAYGTRVTEILKDAKSLADLGEAFGADLSEAEVLYLARSEWAASTEDILWRRSKLGLRFSSDEVAALGSFLNQMGRSRSADPMNSGSGAEKDGSAAPQRKLANEKTPGETIDYDELLKTWTAATPKK